MIFLGLNCNEVVKRRRRGLGVVFFCYGVAVCVLVVIVFYGY